MAIFQSRGQQDLLQVREKLAADEAAVLRLRTELDAGAVEAAISGNFADAETAHASIRAAETRIIVARSAIGQLEVAEQERLAEARQKEQKAKLRAFRQHSASLQNAAKDFERYAGLLNGSWRRMLGAAGKAISLVPPNMAYEFPYRELSSGVLFRRGETELARAGRVDADHYTSPQPAMPGSEAAPLGGTLPQDLPSLSAEVRQVLNVMSQRLGQHLALTPLPPPPVHSESTPYAGPDPGSEAWAEREMARQNNLPEPTGIMAKVAEYFSPFEPPAVPPDGNTHPVGSQAHEEFQRALAEIATRAVPPSPALSLDPEPAALEDDAEGMEDGEAATSILDDEQTPLEPPPAVSDDPTTGPPAAAPADVKGGISNV